MPDVFNYSATGINILHIKCATVAWCIQLFGKGINILHIKCATVAWCVQLFGKVINVLYIKCATVPDVFNYSLNL